MRVWERFRSHIRIDVPRGLFQCPPSYAGLSNMQIEGDAAFAKCLFYLDTLK